MNNIINLIVEPIFCCDSLINCNSIELISINPFKSNKSKLPIFYFLDDGGHGGFYEIKYCPFCGEVLKYEYK